MPLEQMAVLWQGYIGIFYCVCFAQGIHLGVSWLCTTSIPPYANLLVGATAPDSLTVRTPVQREDLVLVARQVLLQLAGPHIPHLERGVLAAAGQQPAVCREARHVHRADVRAEREEEFPVPSGPQLDMVVPCRGRQEVAVGREADLVDLLLVARHARHGLVATEGCPEEEGAVFRSGCQALDDFAVDGGSLFEARFRFCEFFFWRGGHFTRVVVVRGSEDEVGGESEMVHPMRVAGQCVDEGAVLGVPHFDGLVVRGGVYSSCASPFYARHAAFVP